MSVTAGPVRRGEMAGLWLARRGGAVALDMWSSARDWVREQLRPRSRMDNVVAGIYGGIALGLLEIGLILGLTPGVPARFFGSFFLLSSVPLSAFAGAGLGALLTPVASHRRVEASTEGPPAADPGPSATVGDPTLIDSQLQPKAARLPRNTVVVSLIVLSALGCGREAPRSLLTPVSPRPPAGIGGFSGAAPNTLSASTALAFERAERDPYWVRAYQTADRDAEELQAQREAELRQGLVRAILQRGDPVRKRLALTFDDGPHPDYTPQLLRILARHRVPATFFVVGEMAEKYPDLVQAEARSGHTIGNHTYHHVSLPKIPPAYVATEIKACGEVIQAITGKGPHLFRPPGGDYNDTIAETAEELGYTTVLWTDDPGDFASPGDPIIEERTLRGVGNGGILLLHDGVQQTVDVLPQLLQRLRKRGFEFVTLDEMLSDRDWMKSRSREAHSPAGREAGASTPA